MAYVAVTVQHGNDKRDLALPMHVPSRMAVEAILQVLKITRKHGQDFYFGLQTEMGVRPISPNASLGEAGVLHGAVLALLEQKQDDAPPQTGAYLRNEAGSMYTLSTRITLIGRNDLKSGIFVEIDLSQLANEPKAISRRHAQIEQEGDRFYIVDLGSANGTKHNSQRLVPHEKKPLWDGDVIEFGRAAARLTFCAGEKKA